MLTSKEIRPPVQTDESQNRPVRHILSISGGKDSAALAVYMRDRVAEMEYVFCDTEKELPETYEYLGRLEAYLGKPIVRLMHDGRGFDHYLDLYRGYLPSARMRWCTRHLKLEPFERYVNDDPVISYVGIRADEDREGFLSTKPNIQTRFPFKEDGLILADVQRILDEAGLGLPAYYGWRTRSGCYFGFFQRKNEWVALLENRPDLFNVAEAYEKTGSGTAEHFTWNDGESLEELSTAGRVAAIKRESAERMARACQPNAQLKDVLTDSSTDDDRESCLICHL